MGNSHAIGIDLGTTYSAVARLDDDGRSAMMRNAEGELLTPSVVLFEEEEILVGRVAKKAAVAMPEKVAMWAKRDVGESFYSKPIGGKQIPPEVIQACVLRHLKEGMDRDLEGEKKVVITVPAYFDEPRRKATADSGEMAGLDVIDIVNEPTAAAMAFGEQLGYLTDDGSPHQTMKVLVYDLGGGTFDVTVILLEPGNIRTLATDGDVQLGGRDWDQRLLNHAAEHFRSQYNLDPRDDAEALIRLITEVEQAKHTLSQREQAVIRLDFAGHSTAVTVTRLEFEQMTEDLLERTSFTTRQVIAAADLRFDEIDRVLVVGGSTRMPMVLSMLGKLTGQLPDKSVNPDEGVARGAAIYAGYLLKLAESAAESGIQGPAFRVTDVNSHSLGIQGIDPVTRERANMTIIPRNTSLPAKVTQQFITEKAEQKSIVVQVLEGESRQPELCTHIGRSVLRNLPANLAAGSPVFVTYEYGRSGRLNVRADVTGTGKELAIELERDKSLSVENLSRWKQVFDGEVTGAQVDALATEATPSQPTASASPASATQRPLSPGTTVDAPTPSDPAESDESSPNIARWVTIGGYVMASTVGLVIGYIILRWLRPEF